MNKSEIRLRGRRKHKMAASGKIEIMSIIHVLFLIYGVYNLFNVVNMKREKKISYWMVAPQERPGLYDQDGFIRRVIPLTLFFAAACIAYGLISICNTYMLQNNMLSIVVPVGFLICIMFYISALKSAKREFIH